VTHLDCPAGAKFSFFAFHGCAGAPAARYTQLRATARKRELYLRGMSVMAFGLDRVMLSAAAAPAAAAAAAAQQLSHCKVTIRIGALPMDNTQRDQVF
jgi:hypothetical protein